jgi:hypothetical protein
VVLPWVPETATVLCCLVTSPSTAALFFTGTEVPALELWMEMASAGELGGCVDPGARPDSVGTRPG